MLLILSKTRLLAVILDLAEVDDDIINPNQYQTKVVRLNLYPNNNEHFILIYGIQIQIEKQLFI